MHLCVTSLLDLTALPYITTLTLLQRVTAAFKMHLSFLCVFELMQMTPFIHVPPPLPCSPAFQCPTPLFLDYVFVR